MRLPLAGLLLVLSLVSSGDLHGQDASGRFQIESRAVGVAYDIEVVTPAESSAVAKYPVAYCMDWYILDDYLKSLPGLMALGRLVEPYILVGIAQGSTTEDWAAARTRDFTPVHPADEYSRSHMYPPALDATGGAQKFVAFLESELIPQIESRYPADPSRRCFVGYSLGSLLGVYVMTERTGLFQDYILGSPSLWFNDYYLSSMLEEGPADRLAAIEKVYVSVGEEESWEMLKSFDLMRSALTRTAGGGPEIKAEIIDAAGHVGAMPISLYNGFRFIFQND